VLRCRELLPWADHFFTAASITLRDNPDEWNGVATLAGVSPDRLRLLDQVHGRSIAITPPAGTPWVRPRADGVITDDPSVALVVRVADCAPILLADRRLGVTAAVHAGWRSTMQGIVRAAIDALRMNYGTEPADLVAAIGPSLGVCCGDMGDEVVTAFRAMGHDDATLDRWFTREPGKRPRFDLWRANGEQLESSGVPATAIHMAGLCTRTYPDVFHSYRAAGPEVGRMAALIRCRLDLRP
jgi:YfiH family protein